MLRTIIEGEPGIFPDPVARALRTIGGWFGHRSPAAEPEPPAGPEPTGATEPAEPAGPGDAPVTPTTPLDDDRSDESK